MNSLEKHLENQEHKVFMAKQQERIYYLQRKLREKKIKYNSRKRTVFPTSLLTDDKHVQKLQNNHGYTVQTIIE